MTSQQLIQQELAVGYFLIAAKSLHGARGNTMTEFKLTYHIKRKVSFQAQSLKHAQSLAKSVVNTIHRGIDDSDFLILAIEQSSKPETDEPEEKEKGPSVNTV